MPDSHTTKAAEIMAAFAHRTGIEDGRPERRYLWTDAFAVCNFLGLANETRAARHAQFATRLIDAVHQALGRHREDDARSGWISGLPEADGSLHPTRGGLRIGKRLPERDPAAAGDDAEEWDRDGQYFHYLTKWMHALDQAARATAQPRFNRWARELAATAQRAFAYRSPEGPPRMYWKMSIDLRHPLVSSMGQHDALDGYITCLQLRTSPSATDDGPTLEEETSSFARMAEAGEWATTDPLGIGSLLCDAFRFAQVARGGQAESEGLLELLLASAFAGLRHYARSGELDMPTGYRLAFRELGLSIGLHAVALMRDAERSPASSFSADAKALLRSLQEYFPMAADIESFWLDPLHRDTRAWSDHRDINEVMLATSLAPQGFLVLFPGR